MTRQTAAVLECLLAEPSREWYGFRLSEAAGIRPGTSYPILAKLERLGWVTSSWEEADPAEEGRPRRRFYRLTGEGARAARQLLAARYSAEPARGTAWGLHPGAQAT
jgi:PadR family transcriptional regulator, regulatory protein PadR